MAESDFQFQYCPYCSNYLASQNQVACNKCSRIFPKREQHLITMDLTEISGALHIQAQQAAAMMRSMVHAQALPLTDLLGAWWNGLNANSKQMFSLLLLDQCVALVRKGYLNTHLEKALNRELCSAYEHMSAESIAASLKDFDKDGLVQRAMAAYICQLLEGRGKHEVLDTPVRETVIQLVRETAERQMRDQLEVVESAVRDRMTSIEEMTEKIVREVTDEASKEVRARMRRED